MERDLLRDHPSELCAVDLLRCNHNVVEAVDSDVLEVVGNKPEVVDNGVPVAGNDALGVDSSVRRHALAFLVDGNFHRCHNLDSDGLVGRSEHNILLVELDLKGVRSYLRLQLLMCR